MHEAIALSTLAFVLSLVSTPLFRRLFVWFDIYDHPDEVRKLHAHPVPPVGGPAIVFSYIVALAVVLILSPHHTGLFLQHEHLLLSLLPPLAIVFFTGLVDDLLKLGPKAKLVGLLIGAITAVSLGARITQVAGHHVSPWLGIPLSLFWLLACSNALNLIDGLDGLATGVAFFATLATMAVALMQGNSGLVIATIPLAACLLGFLVYNFNPASAYLGDSGSLTLGFLLGCFGLIWSSSASTALGALAPLMALALPLLDVSLSIGRRYLSSNPILQGDRNHIHHRLLSLGFSTRSVALILYGVCAIAAILSVLHSALTVSIQELTLALFFALGIIGVRRLEYAEFSAAKEIFSRRTFARILRERTYLETLKRSITAAKTPEACWHLVCATCSELEVSSALLEFEGDTHSVTLKTADEDPSWQMCLALGGASKLHFAWHSEPATPSLALLAFSAFQQRFCDFQAEHARRAHQSTPR